MEKEVFDAAWHSHIAILRLTNKIEEYKTMFRDDAQAVIDGRKKHLEFKLGDRMYFDGNDDEYIQLPAEILNLIADLKDRLFRFYTKQLEIEQKNFELL